MDRQAKHQLHKRARKERNRRFVFDHLSTHPCVDCGEGDPVVLDFDHVRGTKDQGIARMIQEVLSLDRLWREIEKCEVVCANCHRRRTARQFGWACLDYE